MLLAYVHTGYVWTRVLDTPKLPPRPRRARRGRQHHSKGITTLLSLMLLQTYNLNTAFLQNDTIA